MVISSSSSVPLGQGDRFTGFPRVGRRQGRSKVINGGAVHARKGSLPVDLGSAINQVDDAFFDLDPDWRVRFANVAARRGCRGAM